MISAEGHGSVEQTRVLYVSDEPVFNLGGAGKIVQWLISDLSKQYRISLASPDAETAAAREGLPCLENCMTIPDKKWSKSSRNHLRGQINAGGYKLIHFHGGTFSFDAHLPWRSPLPRICLSGIPWILSNHCAPSLTEGLFPPGYPRASKFLKTAVAWLSKSFLLGKCRQEVFDSDENRLQIEKWFPWARSKMRTIYHSALEGKPPRPSFSPEVITIANLGHVAWRKGQADLLKAFAQVHDKFPRLRLCLAGPEVDKSCGQSLRDEIVHRKLEACVDMPGGLKDTSAFWTKVDIYVQPSRFEGAPMALMEALWRGKPAVGTRVSGIPEMIDHDVGGLLVEAGDPAQLAAAIERLVVEADTRRRLGENAAAKLLAKGMTRRDMSNKYADLYSTILGKAAAKV